MIADLSFANYRCFAGTNPAQIRIEPGRIAIVGTNNAGKTAALRLFYELRGLFSLLSGTGLKDSMNGRTAFTFASSIADQSEIFHDLNNEPIHLQIDTKNSSFTRAVISIDRGLAGR